MPRKPKVLLSGRAYARHRGCSKTSVQRAIIDGRIPTNKDGKIDPAKADRSWAANTDQSKPANTVSGDPSGARPKKKSSNNKGRSKPALEQELVIEVADKPTSSYAKNRSIREGYNARLLKLQYDKEVGKLLDADEVRVAVFNGYRRCRDQLQAMVDQLAPIVAAKSDARECHNIMINAVRRACDELANGKLRL